MIRKIRKAISDPRSLGERAINAGLWNVASTVAQHPLRLASNLIMTRLLAPGDFALMATVFALHMGLGLLSDVGIAQSVMRSPKGDTPRFLRVAWIVQIIRGLVLAGFLLILGGLIWFLGPRYAAPDSVYADPVMPWLVWASALVFLLRGLQSTSVLLARRRLRLKRVAIAQFITQVVAILVMISSALVLENVWALLIGTLAGNVAMIVLSHGFIPGPRMRYAWDAVQAREMWRFGKWLIGASLGGFLISHSDRLLFAALVDKTLFGVYAIALLWTQVATQLLQKVGSAIFVPSFAETLNKSPGRIHAVLTKAFFSYSVMTLSVGVLITVSSALIIYYLYDSRYSEAMYMVAILGFRIALQRYLVFRQFIVATGDSRYSAIVSLAGGGITLVSGTFVLIYVGFYWSLVVFSLGALPMLLGIVLHREVQKHIRAGRQVVFMVGTVIACVMVTMLIQQSLP